MILTLCGEPTKRIKISTEKQEPPIIISFLPGIVETQNAIKCGEIINYKLSSFKIDTIFIDSLIIKDIIHQIENLKTYSNNDSLFPGCDVRIDCRIIDKNNIPTKLCIGQFNCILRDGHLKAKNDTLIYLIRKYSGYYNFISKKDLAFYFDEIKQFGIPSNYKDLTPKKNPEGFTIPPLKEACMVILQYTK